MPDPTAAVRVEGPKYKKLVEALVDAFPSTERLSMMLEFRLKKKLAVLTSTSKPLDIMAFEVIGDANARGWTGALIHAARESNPENSLLLRFAEDYGLSAARPELERRVREDLSFLDIAKWRERLGRIEGQVCRVELPNLNGIGTGFLLAPDVVMTNYHVIEDVKKGKRRREDLVLRFDYKELDGTVVGKGAEFRLADDWLIDDSPYSQIDQQVDPGSAVPADDELDYALLRVAGSPGSTPVGAQNAEPTADERGFLAPREQEFPFVKDGPIFIVQHPNGAPLKLAMDTKGVLELNSNRTRVRYKTNTDPGSSGSPVFDQNWDLVALHHSGDRTIVPVWNEGIPMSSILALLKKRGKSGVLGEQD